MTLRERLHGGERLVGTFALTASPVVAETLARCGLDFVLIDCEHAETSPLGSELAHLVRAVDAGGSAPAVRVAAHDAAQIGRALDCGAQAVVVPRVEDAAAARAAVRAARRPPAGIRGAAPVVRAAGYGTVPWGDVVAAEPLVAVLVETPRGVEDVEAIAATDGLDVLFFGAFDLAVAWGLPDPRAVHPVVEEARRRVYAAASAHGLAVADYAWSTASARAFLDAGAAMVAVGTDLSALVAAFAPLAEQVRAAPPAPADRAAPLPLAPGPG